jgi:hypothetical protein
MKIIRLVSTDPQGYFDNDFNEDITVEPNSSIALHSLTAEINIEQITVDAQNDLIQFKMFQTDDTFKVFHVQQGIYNSSNYNTLFDDITVKMNKLMGNIQGEIGYQWQVGTDIATKKVNFCNKQGEYILPKSTGNRKFGTKNLTGTVGSGGVSGVWNRTTGAGTPGFYDSFMYFKSPNCKGSSTLRTKIYQTGFTDGFILGYTTKPYDTTTALINPSDIKYGIRCTEIGQVYKTILDGVETDSTTTAQIVATNNVANDNLSIDINKGNIKLNVTRGDGATINLLTLDGAYNHTTDLFPVIVFLGDNNCRLYTISFSSDAFYNIINEQNYEISLNALPSAGTKDGNRILQFGDIDMSKYLGYKLTQYTQGVVNGATNFLSDVPFSPSDFSDSFVIELQNINIDSYDGLTNKRRNLLHTIVQADVIRNRLTYTAPYPLFLNLNNQHKMVLRRVRARLLREDLTPTSLTGYSQITLIIN